MTYNPRKKALTQIDVVFALKETICVSFLNLFAENQDKLFLHIRRRHGAKSVHVDEFDRAGRGKEPHVEVSRILRSPFRRDVSENR